MSSALINITYKTLYLQQTSKIGCFNHPSDGNNHFHLFPFQGPLIFCLLVCFYRSIHFVKGPIKTEHDNTGVFVRSIIQLEKDHSMIETCRLKNIVIFFQEYLSFVLLREIINRLFL